MFEQHYIQIITTVVVVFNFFFTIILGGFVIFLNIYISMSSHLMVFMLNPY